MNKNSIALFVCLSIIGASIVFALFYGMIVYIEDHKKYYALDLDGKNIVVDSCGSYYDHSVCYKGNRVINVKEWWYEWK